jgi:hypothetical protein
MKTTSLVCAALVLLSACGKSSKNQNTATNATPLAAADDPRPVVYLEGIYATSAAPGQRVENLFDTDPTNAWQTLPGAGPDEGIMLYFQNALPLAALQAVPTEGSFVQNPDLAVEIFVNGTSVNAGRVLDTLRMGDQPVKSLFVRFRRTGKETQTQASEALVEGFPSNASIGLKSLNLLNDKGESLRIAPPRRVDGTLTASSTLAPETAYSPANLFDSRKEFAWAEGAASAGEGEVLTFQFDQAVNITAIQIWDGYQRSDEHFSANARVRDFDFGEKGGTARTYTLRDTKAGQKIELQAAAKGNAFELKIKSIYPGKKYKDLAISDIVFYDGAQPFVLTSALAEKYRFDLRAKSAASPLAAVLDRRISNRIEANSLLEQSLVLRSDGTFVLYSQEVEPGGTQSLADGNWEITSANATTAQIKVFGKWTNTSEIQAYYAGSGAETFTRIFNDVLTLDGRSVRGQKMVGTFYLK